MTKQLRSVGTLSCMKVFAILYAMIGLLIGGLISLFSLAAAGFGAYTSGVDSPLLGLVLGAGAVVVLPILYSVFGAIGGLVISVFYNLAAKVTGGIELEIE